MDLLAQVKYKKKHLVTSTTLCQLACLSISELQVFARCCKSVFGWQNRFYRFCSRKILL